MTIFQAELSGASCGTVRSVVFIVALLTGGEPHAQRVLSGEQLHAQAVDRFRLGRFPEAYGRFVELANAGHPPSARVALWMCEQGPSLFGRDWDCTPEEVADWSALIRRPIPGHAQSTLHPAVSTGLGARQPR